MEDSSGSIEGIAQAAQPVRVLAKQHKLHTYSTDASGGLI